MTPNASPVVKQEIARGVVDIVPGDKSTTQAAELLAAVRASELAKQRALEHADRHATVKPEATK